MGNCIKCSIIIPTYNNVSVLRNCVERWQRFSSAIPDIIELVVIEDGCNDGTPTYLSEVATSEWGRRHLRWFHEDDAHELICTNRGLAEARGSIIVAWQDDMLLNAHWFVPELLSTFHSNTDLGLISFSRGLDCLPFDEPISRWDDLQDPRRVQSTIGSGPLNWLRLQEVDIVIRPWAVRRACIEKVGPLDKSFRPTEWDEADLCFRIRQAGWKVATHGYERLGAYIHLGSTTLKFSEEYRGKVLRNGQLFFGRWQGAIQRGHSRERCTWWRGATGQGWRWTLWRMLMTLPRVWRKWRAL